MRGRRPPLKARLATTTILLCLAEGLGSSSMFAVPVVCATVSSVGGLVYARFMGRHL
jgi:multisubunit Na+/H+ antiporter MnhF subunit